MIAEVTLSSTKVPVFEDEMHVVTDSSTIIAPFVDEMLVVTSSSTVSDLFEDERGRWVSKGELATGQES